MSNMFTPHPDDVRVVRCKDCDKGHRSFVMGKGWRYCEQGKQTHKEDHYCGYGNRRGENA